MKHLSKPNPAFLFIFLLFCFLTTSCITQKNLQYLEVKGDQSHAYQDPSFEVYKIKPDDALYIRVNSLDESSSTGFFSEPLSQQNLEPYGAYMNSYTVDIEGVITLPVIGKINVLGKTTSEVSALIQDSLSNILSLPTVTVKLVNRYISVLGEVNNPGHYIFSQDKLTIYNAIALAGDIGIYGNRKEVQLTRNVNGRNIVAYVDLTKSNMLTSPYYYVQPNDLIYVRPLRKRFWGLREFPFTIIFSTITTGLLIYTVTQSN